MGDKPTPDGRTSWYRITNLGSTAEVYLYDEIGEWGVTAAQFSAELRSVAAGQIDLHIGSRGGDVFDAVAIYNALRGHPARIEVYVDSIAASAASFIAMSGDRITMRPNSQMMIHEARTVCMGDAQEMEAMRDVLNMHSDNIASIYARRAGGSTEEWRGRMRATTWYTAEQAVAAGLADEVRDFATAPDMAEAPPVLDVACPTHHTDTATGAWDKGIHEGRLPSPMTVATAKAMYGWYDPDRVEDGRVVKDGCKLPHHEVSADGTPGPANLAAVRNALARLPQSDIPAAERDAIEAHLRAHLSDAPQDVWAALTAHLTTPRRPWWATSTPA